MTADETPVAIHNASLCGSSRLLVMEPDLLRSLVEGATLVTPNRRLARDLKRRFDAAQSAQGLGLWPTPDICP